MKKTFWFLLVGVIIILGLLIYLALPYPFTPLGVWLESLFVAVEECVCFYPWWLFVLGQIGVCLAILFWQQLYSKPSRGRHLAFLALVGIGLYIFHLLIYNYFVIGEIVEPSVYDRWLWLMFLIVFGIFGVLKLKIVRKV